MLSAVNWCGIFMTSKSATCQKDEISLLTVFRRISAWIFCYSRKFAFLKHRRLLYIHPLSPTKKLEQSSAYSHLILSIRDWWLTRLMRLMQENEQISIFISAQASFAEIFFMISVIFVEEEIRKFLFPFLFATVIFPSMHKRDDFITIWKFSNCLTLNEFYTHKLQYWSFL